MTKYHLTGKRGGGDDLKGYSKYLYNYYTVKKYNDNNYRITVHKYPILNSGFEIDRKLTVNRNVNDEKLSNNIARAKSDIYEYAMCNDFDYFVTLTLDEKKYDRYDLKTYIKDLGQFIRDYRKKYKVNIQYLFVPEKHLNGAWHVHGLIKGIPRDHLHKNKNGYLDWSAYGNKFGWISLGEIRSKEAVSKYILKYVNKDVGKSVTEKNKKLFYASRGLKKAEIIKKGTLSGQENIPLENMYENDYVKIINLTSLEDINLQ